uniref:Uncharacterized protein n=1 Tax=Arundo donax TaxID=35708 RepID=A0A0A9AIU1_ARUDO
MLRAIPKQLVEPEPPCIMYTSNLDLLLVCSSMN